MDKCKLTGVVDLLFPAMKNVGQWGLFDGRIGFIIFLFCLYRKTKIKKYEQNAEELLNFSEDGIQYESFGYRNGLTGIGIGFNYLINEKYIEIEDGEDILGSFDENVRAFFYNNLHSLSYDELYGIGKYFYYRIAGHHSDNEISFLQKKELMIDWISVVEKEYNYFVLHDPLAFSSLVWDVHSLNLFNYKTTGYIERFDMYDASCSDDVYNLFGVPLFQLLYMRL